MNERLLRKLFHITIFLCQCSSDFTSAPEHVYITHCEERERASELPAAARRLYTLYLPLPTLKSVTRPIGNLQPRENCYEACAPSAVSAPTGPSGYPNAPASFSEAPLRFRGNISLLPVPPSLPEFPSFSLSLSAPHASLNIDESKSQYDTIPYSRANFAMTRNLSGVTHASAGIRDTSRLGSPLIRLLFPWLNFGIVIIMNSIFLWIREFDLLRIVGTKFFICSLPQREL